MLPWWASGGTSTVAPCPRGQAPRARGGRAGVQAGAEDGGGAEGTCGCCTYLSEAWPHEERGKALRRDVLRKKKKKGLLEVGWGERNSCRARQQKLRRAPLLLSALSERCSCSRRGCWGSAPSPVPLATCAARLQERGRPAAGSLAAPRGTALGSRRGLVQEVSIKARGSSRRL